MFQQAAIAVVNGEHYRQLHTLLDAAFAERDVEVFLHRVRRSGVRIRNYEGVLGRGLLGKLAASLYGGLPVSDQGQTRERFLQMVEEVSPELRQKYATVFTQY